ncbi:MAG: hypothetical protein K2L95_02845 [Alphaproteobacteria bacterium]|nr:hypothetical protein [Alphaproteobacteria bacterium]MDE6571128.1 hypothetical protein [Alphaproteobacteria bacterium]
MATMLERNKKVKAPKKTREEYAEDALYREVWEEVNNEKTQRFLKKYSRVLIGGALAILIVATGIQIGVHSYRASKIAAAQNYESAIENRDANALAGLAANTSGATSDLALFQAYLLDGDVAKLEQLAEHGHTRDFRDLARIHVVTLRGDKMSAADVEKYLAVADTKKSPFYYTARLTVAQKYLADGDRAAAMKILDKIVADKNAPAMVAASAAALR